MKRLLSILTVTLLVFTLLTGCGTVTTNTASTTDEPLHLGLILGSHHNFPAIQLAILTEEIERVTSTYGTLTSTVSDGNPHIRGDYHLKKLSVNNKAKQRQVNESNAKAIMNDLAKHTAKTPEVDILTALQVSADSIRQYDGEKTILIFESGLSTIGLLNFSSTNLIEADPTEVVTELKRLHAIPDLTGMDVKWIGLGQTAGEQQEKLSSSYKYNLEQLWRAILQESGCTNINFDSTQLTSEEPLCELPPVSVVPVVQDSLNLTSKSIPEVIKFSEETIKFNGDQATFIDEALARDTLKPIAEYLINNKNEKVYLVGMTATAGNQDARHQLSVDRANKVKDILISFGVNANQLSTVGLGFEPNVLRVKDTDSTGRLIESEACKNRAVFLIQSDSDLVNQLGLKEKSL